MTIPMRRLGTSDLSVSVVGVGCNAFGRRIDADRTREVVLGALDAGVNFFDTADTYGLGASEQMLGDALRGAGRRDEAVIATKFGMDMQGENGDDGGRRGSAAYVRRAAEASLRRLGVDHIDLYQLHTPDPGTPIEETLGAMTELVREGKVRAIGCSNLQAWQLVGAHHRAKAADLEEFVTAQNEYSLYNRTAEVELVPACETLGVSILPYFPLAYGLLTGKYHRGQRPPEGSRLESETHRYENADWDTVDALRAFGEARGLSLLQVAIGGLAAQRAVGSVIAGATRAEQVVANVEAAQWQPSEDDLAELAGIGRPRHSYTTFAPRH